jgi:hypothetical protein
MTGPPRCLICVAVMAFVFIAAVHALAGDLNDEPVGFRIGLALDRGSTFTDVIGLSASAAYPYGSSVNPAADDYLRAPPNVFTLAGTATGNYAWFEGSGQISAGAVSGQYRWPDVGTITVSYSRIDSHDARTHQREMLVLRANEVDVGYSRRVASDIVLGGEVRLTESTLSLAGSAAGFPFQAGTESLGVEGRLGVLAGLGADWLVGATAGVGTTRARTNADVLTPPPPFGFGRLRSEFKDTVNSVNLRLGAGWRPSTAFGAYGDLQYLALSGNDNTVDVLRLFAGLEYLPHDTVAFRVGGSIDDHSNATLSSGLGIYVFKHLQIEAAYVYNAFPEVRREFGTAHVLSLSIVVSY